MRRDLSTQTKIMSLIAAWIVESLSQFSWKAVPQLQTCSCKTPVSIVDVWRHTSLMWRNTADDDLRQRPIGSGRLDRLEPCRTVTGRPGWTSWNPLDVEPETTAALVELALCGRTSSARHQTCNRILHRLQVQPARQTFGDAIKQWVAVVL